MINYYSILGISPSAEPEVIAAAFKAMMRKYHPDANGRPTSTQRAAELNEAYETLRNPERRATYDEALARANASVPRPPPPHSPPPSSPSSPKEPMTGRGPPEAEKNDPKGPPLNDIKMAVIAVFGLIVLVIIVGNFFSVPEPQSEADNQIAVLETNAATPSLVQRTEMALEDQIRCTSDPQPRAAITAMMKNGILKQTNDGWDGAYYFIPTGSLSIFGLPVVRVTGWESADMNDGREIFWRARSGTSPPIFLEVVVEGDREAVRAQLESIGVPSGIVDEMPPDQAGTTALLCYANNWE